MENYEMLNKVGEGAYGEVYKARDKKTGCLVAVMKTLFDKEDEHHYSAKHVLHSMYIVRLLSVEHINEKGKPFLYVVLEYFDMNLTKYMYLHTQEFGNLLSHKEVQGFLYQLLKAVFHCHSHGVLHRNLEPENIFVDKDKGILKIAYVCLGKSFCMTLKSHIDESSLICYRAPEVLLGCSEDSTASDMWSVGCIVAELVRKAPLINGNSESDQLNAIFRLFGTPSEEIWPRVTQLPNWCGYPQFKPKNIALLVPGFCARGVDLLKKLMVYNPSMRISAKDALHHPYFNDLDKSQF